MDILRLATATAVTLGLPVLAMIHPSDRTPLQAPGDPSSNAAVVREPVASPVSAASAPTTPSVHSQTLVALGQMNAAPAQSPAVAAFASEIRRLSDEADSVDRVFVAMNAQCGLRARNDLPDFGRAWFAMLDEDRQFPAAHCGDMWQLVKESGRGIRNDLRRALAQANRAGLDAGTVVGLLRWHSLDAR
jgi:hypothetical protein